MIRSMTLRWVASAFAAAMMFAPALSPARAQEPTVHQIYEAVQGGRLKEAESMIDQVVRDHPKSSKAHYVAAEVYARTGKLDAARGELSKAEQLDPLLSYAKPESIRALRATLRGAGPATAERGSAPPAAAAGSSTPAAPAGVPWLGLLLIGAVVAGGAMWFASRRRSANAMRGAMAPYPGGAGPTGAAMNGYATPSAYPPAQPGMGSGMGSGIGRAVGTAAAVGAGVVAGEAIAHHLMRDRDQGHAPGDAERAGLAAPDDASMPSGPEQDFGVRDDGGWSDAGLGNATDFGSDDGGGDWT